MSNQMLGLRHSDFGIPSSFPAFGYRSYGRLRPKKLPDRSEPWASGIRQANFLHLLPEITCNSPMYYFEHGSQIERMRRQTT